MRAAHKIYAVAFSILGGLSSVAIAAPSLTVSFNTLGVGQNYAPLNCEAVWVETEQAQFIKTIGRWCSTTISGVGEANHLVAWKNKAGLTDVDAVSGATRVDHLTRLTVTWDLKDKLGVLVPDGIYRIRLENADGNSTSSTQNAQATFTFTKGLAPDVRTGLSDPLLPVGLLPQPYHFNVDINFNPTSGECNNGVVDQGETCDPPGSCPVDCEPSGDSCAPNVIAGSSATCTAVCAVQSITQCINDDGCCAEGCPIMEDNDCATNASIDGGCATGGGNGAGVLVLAMVFGAIGFVMRRRR